jgi:hypothetical protein
MLASNCRSAEVYLLILDEPEIGGLAEALNNDDPEIQNSAEIGGSCYTRNRTARPPICAETLIFIKILSNFTLLYR